MDQKFKVAFATMCAFLCVLCISTEAFSQTLPEGKGKAEFVHNCTACHRADMVTRVKKTPDEWRKSVDEMASRGTDGSKEDLDNAYLYLVTNYSTQSATPSSTANGLSTPNSSDTERAKRIIAESGCLTCHRIEQQGAYTAPALNGISARRSTDAIRTAIVNHPTLNPMPSHERKITGEDLEALTRYLVSLPPMPQNP
jgi:mono/diheme cytochrome c family protein